MHSYVVYKIHVPGYIRQNVNALWNILRLISEIYSKIRSFRALPYTNHSKNLINKRAKLIMTMHYVRKWSGNGTERERERER